MTLIDIVRRSLPGRPWVDGEKIPWNEPGFSARMLENHLAQEHDWASRRGGAIERHVKSLLRRLPEEGARVLDLGCGPGLYTERLADAGCACVGIDFSPASIAYATRKAEENHLSAAYVLDDVRQAEPEGRFDAVLMTFGEINVFRREDASRLLRKAESCLKENGFLVLEAHTFEAVRENGHLPSSWQSYESGLFSERPHLLLEEHFWHEEEETATTRYYVVDAQSGETTTYGASMAAYTEDGYERLFAECGLAVAETLPEAEWPTGEVFAGKLKTVILRNRGQ